MIPLSVLDLAVVRDWGTSDEVLDDTTRLGNWHIHRPEGTEIQ